MQSEVGGIGGYRGDERDGGEVAVLGLVGDDVGQTMRFQERKGLVSSGRGEPAPVAEFDGQIQTGENLLAFNKMVEILGGIVEPGRELHDHKAKFPGCVERSQGVPEPAGNFSQKIWIPGGRLSSGPGWPATNRFADPWAVFSGRSHAQSGHHRP